MPDVNQSIVLQSRTKQGQSEAVCWKRYLCLEQIYGNYGVAILAAGEAKRVWK